jgi:hypothetical protein
MGIHRLTRTLTHHLPIPIAQGYVWVRVLSRVLMGSGESEIGCIMRRWYRKLVDVRADVLQPSWSGRQSL